MRYLHDLGVLDRKTICIHCIHVTPEEIRIIAESGAKVCLCPGSNRYLGTGKAPAAMFLDNGILPALGTDSAASNPQLSLWSEMKILQEDHPGINPAVIFSMATLGGARALAIDHEYGTLAPGKKARFLALPLPEGIEAADQLYHYLVSGRQTHLPTWVIGQ